MSNKTFTVPFSAYILHTVHISHVKYCPNTKFSLTRFAYINICLKALRNRVRALERG